MTIAFFTPQMTIGGAQSYVILKSNWLVAQGHRVVVVSAGGKWVDRLSVHTMHIVIDNINVAPYYLSPKKRKRVIEDISDIIVKYQIDVIESHNSFPIIYTLLAQRKTKVPVLLNILSELAYIKNPLLCYVTKLLDKQSLYYTLNNEMNTFIERKIHYRLVNRNIIPIPINKNESVESVRGSYILSVCRMSPEKMYVKYLINDFAKLVEDNKINSSFRLILVGDGVLFKEIEAKVAMLNLSLGKVAIILKGFCEGYDLDLLYANCDIYIGIGTTLLTGALYGKPSIIAGGVPETMPYAWGYWGVDDDDTIARTNFGGEKYSFYTLIEQTLNDSDLYQKTSMISLNKATNKYSADNIMQKWEQEYIKVSKTKNKIKYTLINSIINVLYCIGVILSLMKLNKYIYKNFDLNN